MGTTTLAVVMKVALFVVYGALASGQAPGMMDYSTLNSAVVNLFRLRLSWAVPTGTITGYNISCGGDMCDSVVAISNSVNLLHTADVNSMLQVFIAALNGGEAADAGAGRMLPVATFDNARPMTRVTVLTNSFFLLDWTLPQTAMGDGITVNSMYGVVVGSSASTMETSPVIVDASRVTPFSGNIQVTVTPTYTSPSITGTNVAAIMSVTIPSADAVQPILNINAGFAEGLSSATTVSWQAPPVTAMLEGYFVTYNITNLVDGSLVTANNSVPVSSTSVVIPACPYCEVVVDVDANYAGSNRAQLFLTSRYITRQASPSAPRSVIVTRSDVRELTITWETPSNPNGIIRNYYVSYTVVGGSSRREEVGSNATIYIFRNLLPNTNYSIFIVGFTAAADGGAPSAMVTQTSGFGVIPPSSVSVSGTEVTFTLNGVDGPIGRYLIVISTASLANISSKSAIPAYSSSASAFHGARVGIVAVKTGQMQTFTVAIGTGIETTESGFYYEDRKLQSNTDYFIFIRAFSKIDEMVFSDRYVNERIRINADFNVAAIAAPIVLVCFIPVITFFVITVIIVERKRQLKKGYEQGTVSKTLSSSSNEANLAGDNDEKDIDTTDNVCYGTTAVTIDMQANDCYVAVSLPKQ